MLQGVKSGEPDIGRGVFEKGDGVGDGLAGEFGKAGFETFGRDAIDRPGVGWVLCFVAANFGVIPVGDIGRRRPRS